MNLEEIAQVLEFEVEDVIMLVDMFLDNAKESLNSVDEAISTANYQEIKNIAHAIKGSASNLMLDDITQCALEIEQLAKDELNAEYSSLFNDLKSKINMIEELKATV